jgi:hypothetical protein
VPSTAAERRWNSAALATIGVKSKPKAFSIASPPLSARSVCHLAVAANDQPAFHKGGKVTAQRCLRHAVGAPRQISVRRENDNVVSSVEHGSRVERQKDVGKRQGAV